MARHVQPTKEEEAEYAEWVAGLPEPCRSVAQRFDIWTLYRMNSTGHRIIINGFNENGTLSVVVNGRFNAVIHDRVVFGIDPDDLEECEAPGPDEPVGSMLTQAEARDNIDELRAMIRPDLWRLDADGVAHRRPPVRGKRH